MQNCFLLCFNSVFFHKSGHKCCDRSGPFLQIRSHIHIIYIYIYTACYQLVSIGISPIMDGIPDNYDLMLKDSVKIKNGMTCLGSVFSKMQKDYSWLHNFTELAFMINKLTGENADVDIYTWASVHQTNQLPLKLGVIELVSRLLLMRLFK